MKNKLKSAWAFKRSSDYAFDSVRQITKMPTNTPSAFQDWFLGQDGIYNNRVQRWDGTKWVQTDIKFKYF